MNRRGEITIGILVIGIVFGIIATNWVNFLKDRPVKTVVSKA